MTAGGVVGVFGVDGRDRRAGPDAGDGSAGAAGVPVGEHWEELVTTALLGTDRRDPPAAGGALGDLVADTARGAPSERMLAQVAACVAVRRAGFLPGPALPPPAAPPADDRPVCVPAATDRWRHITTSWPVLEDEWMLTLIGNGWRVAPELVPAMLRRHRRDPVRLARVAIAAGPVAAWLVEHLPELATTSAARTVSPTAAPTGTPEREAVGAVAELPIPPELAALLDRPGAETGRFVAGALAVGDLGIAHRAVLVNLVARVRADGLVAIGRALDAVDPHAPGHGLAASLADVATTRHRMLDELARG